MGEGHREIPRLLNHGLLERLHGELPRGYYGWGDYHREIPRGILGATTGVLREKYGYNGVTTRKYRGRHWGFGWGRGCREITWLLNHGLLV